MNYNSELEGNNAGLRQILNAVKNLPSANGGGCVLTDEEKKEIATEAAEQLQPGIDEIAEELAKQSEAIAELEGMISGSGGDVEYVEKVTSDNKFDNVFDETGKLDFTTGEDGSASTLVRSSQYYDLGDSYINKNIYSASSEKYTDGSEYKTAVLFYDENKAYTGEYLYLNKTDGEKLYGSVWVTKSTKFFRIYKTAAYTGQIYVSPVNPGSVDAANFEYKKEMVAVGGGGITVNANKKLAGKVVVNFGDSIFGKRRPPDDISTELADITGATVHNCGFGGCHMSNHWATTYNAFSMCNLADAIVSGDWTAQDAAITETETQVVPTYFAEALEILKGLDFNDVDIITIAYGTNDWNSGDAIDNTESPYDKTSFASALRYSVEALLTAFPHLKIFVCSQTYRFFLDDSNVFTEDSDTKTNTNGVKLIDFVAKTKEVAEQYHLPYIDNYNIGINKFNRGYYFPATDGTHPLTVGCHLIAENMANEMY